jgi:N-acetyl sugar amidotransferase
MPCGIAWIGLLRQHGNGLFVLNNNKNSPMTQVCKRCAMDTVGDPLITFEPDGTCNYCNYALSRMDKVYFPNEIGQKRLEKMINKLKKNGSGKKYDCIMGISGGLDSAYLAYLGSMKWGLRILGVHFDDGLDAPVATQNIKNLCSNCKIDLEVISPDKKQYMNLTRSFFLAGVTGLCIPQDNILIAALFRSAEKHNIKYFLSGTNFALESILQRGNMHIASDTVHIRAIQKQFGTMPINDLPLISTFDRYIGYKYFKGQKYIRPLDWIDYNRNRAVEELRSVGFNYYNVKHWENILTKFLQVYYLPKKFNLDIRKSHLSSLIISGQMTRDEVLAELKGPLYEQKQMDMDIALILENLGLSREEFDRIMNEPPRKHTDYKFSPLMHFAGLARKFRKILSD